MAVVPYKQLAVEQKQDQKPVVSAPALHAARTVKLNFQLIPKPVPGRNPAEIKPSDYNVALLIDSCVNVNRLEELKDRAAELHERVDQDLASKEEILEFLYDLGVAYNYLPTY